MQSAVSSCRLETRRVPWTLASWKPHAVLTFFLIFRRLSMRTHLIRGVLLLAVVFAMSAPALAQSVVRGKVVDGQGKPVPEANVLFEAEGVNRQTRLKTDRNGEFLQVGLQ